MKKQLCTFTKIVCFIFIFLCLYRFVDIVFVPKRTDGITTMQGIYAQPKNSVDVLFLGSSLSGMDIDEEVLWKEYGIAGYNLWGSVQPLWNSYYFLKEALKYQKPKLVVLEIYAASFLFSRSDNSRRIVNTRGMRFSWNQIEAVLESTSRRKVPFLLAGLPHYHNRYTELSVNDYMHFTWSKDKAVDKGSSVRYTDFIRDLPDITSVMEISEMHPKAEKYLRKIIELCEKHAIPIVLLKNPSASRETEQPYYNYAKNIADEYGISFLNTNLYDSEINLKANDFFDNAHLNTRGSRKITQFIAAYIKEHYTIPDRRGDVRYSSWEENAQRMEDAYIKLITNKGDYVYELKRNERVVYILSTGSSIFDKNEYTTSNANDIISYTKTDKIYIYCKEHLVAEIAESLTENGCISIVYNPYNDTCTDIAVIQDSDNITHIRPKPYH